MKDYDHMQKVLQNNVKLNKETIGEKAIDFAIKVLKEESRSFRGDYGVESWRFNDFHPDIEELYIKWKKKPLNVETKIDNYKHNEEAKKDFLHVYAIDENGRIDEILTHKKSTDEPKTIPRLLMDLKFLDDKPLYVRTAAMYFTFKEANLDDKMSESLTRSFMKYFYEIDSWRVRMNDVWTEWNEFLLDTEEEREKVKIALQIMYKDYNEVSRLRDE